MFPKRIRDDVFAFTKGIERGNINMMGSKGSMKNASIFTAPNLIKSTKDPFGTNVFGKRKKGKEFDFF